MAPLRIVDPVGLYHAISRGNFRRTIFPTDNHFSKYVALLDRVALRWRWTILDWCLIPNHYHLVIQLNDGGLSQGMRELNGGYSRWSNALSNRTGTGHLVKNRFTSRLLDEEAHRWEAFRYVPNNAVLAGLAPRPEQWRWSGYRAAIGLEHPQPFHHPGELLRYFGETPAVAVARYESFVWDGLVRAGHATWSDQGYELRRPPSRTAYALAGRTGVIQSPA